ncbi:MAG: ABC transporter substrate-binding protein [Lachnospiraceae bacterium]|nr:ABC transporter substrate-binding protein [Lachnospiraceae bacterium]
MKKIKRYRLLGLLMAAMMLILSACSSTSSSTETSGSTSVSEGETVAESGSDTEATATGDYAEEVIIGISEDITNFDPYWGTGMQAYRMARLLHSTLIGEDQETGELIPAIATEWEMVDDLTWEFTIRDDVTFWDGTTLTFEDIEWSFNRIATDSRKNVDYIESLEKIDETHFQIHLTEPFITLDYELTGPVFSICSQNSTEDDLIGCGPYQLESYTSGSSIVLTRFDDYYRGTPLTKTITMRIIEEDSSRVIALETGEIDVAEEVPVSERERISENSDLKIESRSGSEIVQICINTTTGATADKRVRQALQYATNRSDIISAAYSGEAEEALSMLAPTMQNYVETSYDYDLEKAKELLEEAGYADGLDITLSCTGTTDQMIAQVLQAQWKEAGINVEIDLCESTAFENAVDNKNYEVCIYTVISTNDEPLEFLEEYYSEFGLGNITGYSNSEYDELYEVISSTREQPTRGEAVEELQNILGEDVPAFSLVIPAQAIGMKTSVDGVTLNQGGETQWWTIYKTE